MKVNRIDIVIPRSANKHIPYLNNEVMDYVRQVKVGGLYANDFIQLNQIPENKLGLLDELKIMYNRKPV